MSWWSCELNEDMSIWRRRRGAAALMPCSTERYVRNYKVIMARKHIPSYWVAMATADLWEDDSGDVDLTMRRSMQALEL